MKYGTAHYRIYILINLFRIGTLSFYATKFGIIKVDLIKKMPRRKIRLWYKYFSLLLYIYCVYYQQENMLAIYRDANDCTIFTYFYFMLRNFKWRADRTTYFSILLCARISCTSTISVPAILLTSRFGFRSFVHELL